MSVMREPALDTAIAEQGLTVERLAVYGDWWASQGDPLGPYVLDAQRASRDAKERTRQFRTAQLNEVVGADAIDIVDWVAGMVSRLGITDAGYDDDPLRQLETSLRTPLTAVVRTLRFCYLRGEPTFEVEGFPLPTPPTLGRVEISATSAWPVRIDPHLVASVREVSVNARSVLEWSPPETPYRRIDLSVRNLDAVVPVEGVRELHIGITTGRDGVGPLLARADAVQLLGLHGFPMAALGAVPPTVLTLVWTPPRDALQSSWPDLNRHVPTHVERVFIHGLKPDRELSGRLSWSNDPTWPILG